MLAKNQGLGHYFRTPMVVLTLGSSNLEYILTVWKYKNLFWEFTKKSIFWPKRVLPVSIFLLPVQFFHFRFQIFTSGFKFCTSGFNFFEKVHISAEKCLFSVFLGILFEQVSSFNCWGPLIWNIYSECGNIKMCFGNFEKSRYFDQKRYFQCGAMLSVICILDKFRPLTVDDF